MAIRLFQPGCDEDWRQARRLVEEYAAGLGVDLSFQGFDRELERLALEYGPPQGCFLLAAGDDEPFGCVGLRRFAEGDAEVKRLYVAPGGRGQRVGRVLAEAIIAEGRRLGYSRLLLDTLPSMVSARSLYRSLGFRSIAPYRFNPIPGTAYLGLDL
jgi:GNAT superfamily N-acetyltransferase